jgi:hypothetical protein
MKNASVYKAIISNITGCVFFIAIFIPAMAHAQSRGTVEVVKDPRIDTLAARRLSLKGSHNAAYSPSANGYRVQIYNGSNRKEAYEAQAKFQDQYPAIRTYIVYNQPNYKVRAGDFRTRLEAEKLMQELRPVFASLFIIQEKINPSKTDMPND